MAQKKQEEQLTYLQMISKSQKEIEKEELELKVQETKSALEIDIATTKRDLSKARKKLNEARASLNYSAHEELKILNEVKALEEGLAFAQNVLETRF